MKIYHNPRCRKSRETLALIEAEGQTAEVVEYLKEGPSKEELKSVLKLLDIPASELLRKKEKIFLEQYKGKDLSEEQWIDAMVAHPILIERPIVVKGNKAVIGRPPENVLKLI
jgi:arsenate reductase